MYTKLILYNKFLIKNMFIIYNLGILYIEPLQVHIYKHTHTVRVQLWLGFLSLEGLPFGTSRSALQMIPLISFIVCT